MAFTSHSYPYNAMSTPSGPTGSPARNQNRPPPRPTDPPNFNTGASSDSKFPLLQYMDVEQLKSLHDNEERLKEMVEDIEEIKQKKLDKEMALAENRSLADFNLSREPRLREGRAQLARLHQEARSVRDILDKDRRQLDGLQGTVSSTEAKVMLETAAEKVEEESEEVADKFLQGEFTTEIFIEQFQELRRLAHVRQIKADKMEELQRNGHISSPSPSHSASGSLLPYSSSSGGALPYSASSQPSSGASPYLSPARPAPAPPSYPGAGSAMGYSAPSQHQPWRPNYGSGNMPMPTLGSYPH